jgi:hypothetical protein
VFARHQSFASEAHVGKRPFCDVTTPSKDNHSFAGGKIDAVKRCGADDVPLSFAPLRPPYHLITA